MERSLHGERSAIHDIASFTDQQLLEKEQEYKQRLSETVVPRQIDELTKLIDYVAFEALYRLGEFDEVSNG